MTVKAIWMTERAATGPVSPFAQKESIVVPMISLPGEKRNTAELYSLRNDRKSKT